MILVERLDRQQGHTKMGPLDPNVEFSFDWKEHDALNLKLRWLYPWKVAFLFSLRRRQARRVGRGVEP